MIEWTDKTWNPVTGCTKVSAGCRLCYAERTAKRLQGIEKTAWAYRNGFGVTLHHHRLTDPFHWRQPQRIFVNSMSDTYHEQVPAAFIGMMWHTMTWAGWHTYQLLTKRAERLTALDAELEWLPHIWQGVSVENADNLGRIDLLRGTGAAVKFLSLEPLLGPLPGLNLDGIDWVIAGGESGPNARPMELDWARDIRDQCEAAEVPFFLKQLGGPANRKRGGELALLDGRLHHAMPGMTGQQTTGR